MKRAIKAQVKVFLEGDEKNAFSHEIKLDVFKSNLRLEVRVPDTSQLRDWIGNRAIDLLEKLREATPDPEMLTNINILEDSATEGDVVLLNDPISSETQEKSILTQMNEQEQFPEELEILIIPDSRNSLSTRQVQKQLQLIVREDALAEAFKHANVDISREAGGVMLGTIVESDKQISVYFTGIVHALRAKRETASVNFTEEAWADIWRTIDENEAYSDETKWKIIGWYHTHPGFGVFLSSRDEFIHREYFTYSGHVALVIDPKKNTHGFFATDKTTNSIPQINHETDLKIVDDKNLLAILDKNENLDIKKLPPSQITNN